ncbi:YjbQ family protein [Rubrobacter taiwanensis]|jgi:secondary thiamine-phosphate synthase enzyme|uniref:YjbQ family protein n=1 Tax=Rubrobacter taiwanensis TaxID=185139 RepID=A0A4R1BHW7_9ACTN|nr:secondary thiamine-phosphate synthase enzyme YjbQ [Rubrobacter taiwanensis]TCJ16821.1 YjbQ family protein [Rubrobacter taiwanensis]
MKVQEIPVRTGERYQFVSITEEVRRAVRESGVEEGFCIVSSTHTTAAITVNEDYDPDVGRDLAAACRALVPEVEWQHAEGNSDSHLLTSLFGQSHYLIIRDGRPDLGRWQGIFLAEFDGPRTRTVRVAVFGG